MEKRFDPLLRIEKIGQEAISEVITNILNWINSRIFQETIQAFGWSDSPDQGLKKRIDALVARSDEWDFRKRTAKRELMGQSREATRWTSHDQLMTPQQVDMANRAATEFKLNCASTPTHNRYRAILVLGGARLSCLLRTKYADRIFHGNVQAKDIVLLGSERRVTESERDATDTYAPYAKTEFGLFLASARKIFSIKGKPCVDQKHEDVHPNLSWKILGHVLANQRRLLIISAPSSDPLIRRANSADTYKFYINQNDLRPGERLLFITSSIYVPYQQLEAIRIITVPLDIHVETLGYPPEWGANLQGMQGPQHYFQEIRSFLQSAQRFINLY